jgi:PAS domain S-box-containing protein
MSLSDDFYALLSSLLKQTAQNPHAPPSIPVNQWPTESEERRILDDLERALTTLMREDQYPSSQPEEREPFYRDIFENTRVGLILQDIETGRVIDANPAACNIYGWTRAEFIGLHKDNIIHPGSSKRFTKYVQAVKSGGAPVSQQVHLRQDGSPFDVELSGTLLKDKNHSYLLSAARDVTKRVREDSLLQQRVEERTREQATLLEISRTLASALELQPGLILDQLQVIIDYTHAGLFKLDGSTLIAMAVRGPQTLELAMPFNIHLHSLEALTLLLNERHSTRIADVQSSDPPAQYLRALLADQASILLEGAQSWMWVPLAIKGRIIGAIGVAHAEHNFFTAHHADLALTVANQAAITMINAELYENAQALAALLRRSDRRSSAAPVGA